MRILLTQVDEKTAQFTENCLGALGHIVRSVGTGNAAVQITRPRPWDAIIQDRILPQLDSLTALKAVLGCEVTTQVLMLNSLSRGEDRGNGLDDLSAQLRFSRKIAT